MTQYTKTDQYGTVRYYSDVDCMKLHRTDGPAVEWADGAREWWLNNQRHRADGPAYEGVDGSRMWYLNGQRHRTDGPAFEWANGTRMWYLNGKRHRTDGPAVEYASDRREWYLNGNDLTFSEWLVSTPVTDAERVMLALKYSEHVE